MKYIYNDDNKVKSFHCYGQGTLTYTSKVDFT